MKIKLEIILGMLNSILGALAYEYWSEPAGILLIVSAVFWFFRNEESL